MGYVFNFKDARTYEEWLSKKARAIELEKELMLMMLKPTPRDRVVDIGCGTGASLLPLLEIKVQATGIDPSSHAIDIASEKIGDRADLHCGSAEDLPFDDNSFDHACLIKTLEFVKNPEKAIEEACRVAKDKVFIGIFNKNSFQITGLRIKRIFTQSIYNHAHFYSIRELRRKIRSIAGNVPISCRTVCGLPTLLGKIGYKIERYSIIQRFPFGAFAGILVIPVPRYRATPLELTCPPEPSNRGAVAGLARTTEWREKEP